MEYFNYKNQLIIYNDDFLEVNIPEDSIDLIVTSPPYNIGKQYNEYVDKLPYSRYLEFTEKWLAKAYKLVKHDGRLCLNIFMDLKGNTDGFLPIQVDVVNIARKVGWNYFCTILWAESTVGTKAATGTRSPKSPYVLNPAEVILVFYKKRWSKLTDGESDITKDEYDKWTVGVWDFHPESRKIGHPAPFPLELPKRCIKLFSYVGDTVLDPFLGSGTTLIACALLNRRGIGIEIDKTYCELAKRRLLKEANLYQSKLLDYK